MIVLWSSKIRAYRVRWEFRGQLTPCSTKFMKCHVPSATPLWFVVVGINLMRFNGATVAAQSKTLQMAILGLILALESPLV